MAGARGAILGVVAAGLLLVVPSSALALTLGSVSPPSGATPGPCTAGAFFAQSSSEPSTSYVVPAGGGSITAWSVNTTGASPGAPLTLVVLRPNGGFTVVGFDAESLPNPLPAGGVATFHIATPITVQAGDILGLYAGSSTGACYFTEGTLSTAASISAGLAPAPSVGATYTASVTAPKDMVNVSAELVQIEDAGVSGAATPASITAGGASEYLLSIVAQALVPERSR